MFNFQGSELVIILLLALVVLGPEKLPEAMRKLGQFYGELKRMSTSFQREFQAAVDEPMRELRETATTIQESADFRKLAAGERDEKPKSAEMVAAADPELTPTDEVPFAPEPAPEDQPNEPDEPEVHPALKPFQSSQAISAAPKRVSKPPEPEVSDDHGSGVAPQVAVDDESGLREARPATDRDAGS